MGRNKLEREFSEKLSTREINPSAAAWDRLDAMLATAEAQKRPRRKYWFFVAAAVVGIALFASLFFPKGNAVQTIDGGSSAVAKTESVPDGKASDSMDTPAIQVAETVPSETKNQPSQNKRVHLQPRHQKEMLAVIQNPEKPEAPVQREITAPVEKTVNNNNSGIPESLLAAIKSKTEAQKTSVVKVDARSLLENVDKQEELTTRQRFLRTVQNVKVAVENRNLEESH
ncbi:hypothetical protein [Flavobacterium silvaticum]|uniref:Uncharacterized protein n=1 Tax=Flavobacterium silvaticum TaxID=1852020 RepID=A0A972JH30_9FLAO|nr:hypothetical protein [Flavobacterium silvaticum]NMH27510.1 hypothetical protein [Flavobacterium silvaticum]